jgi:hypothetical protein
MCSSIVFILHILRLRSPHHTHSNHHILTPFFNWPQVILHQTHCWCHIPPLRSPHHTHSNPHILTLFFNWPQVILHQTHCWCHIPPLRSLLITHTPTLTSSRRLSIGPTQVILHVAPLSAVEPVMSEWVKQEIIAGARVAQHSVVQHSAGALAPLPAGATMPVSTALAIMPAGVRPDRLRLESAAAHDGKQISTFLSNRSVLLTSPPSLARFASLGCLTFSWLTRYPCFGYTLS